MIRELEYNSIRYLEIFPKNYEEGKPYPVIFHTHGAGCRGTSFDNLKTTVIIRKAMAGDPEYENFIVVAPVCHEDTWFDIFERLIGLCEHIYSQPYTDKAHFYASGISMGGYTAYQLMMSRPALFAAGVVCCGGGMYWNAARFKDIPLQVFHGERDRTVLPEESYKMVDRINKNGGCAKLTTYPECAHNCWDNAYSSQWLYPWLLAQTNKNVK